MIVAILLLIASGLSLGGDLRTLRTGHADGWTILWLIFDAATIVMAVVLLRLDRKRESKRWSVAAARFIVKVVGEEEVLKWIAENPDKKGS